MTTAACIVARLGSTRLPRKALIDVGGLPAVHQLVVRLRRAQSVDEIVLCTTRMAEDDDLASYGESLGLRVIRGANNDVLARILQAAEATGAEFIVRVTGDNVFTCPSTLDLLHEQIVRHEADYARMSGLPLGGTPEVMRVSMAKKLHNELGGDTEKSEYLLLYAFDPARHKCIVLQAPEETRRPYYSLTLDTATDHRSICELFNRFQNTPGGPSIAEVVEVLDDIPDRIELSPDTPIRLPDQKTMSYADFLRMMDERGRAALNV